MTYFPAGATVGAMSEKTDLQLINVWLVTDGISGFYCETEDDAEKSAKSFYEMKIEKVPMTRETFERLPKFDLI